MAAARLLEFVIRLSGPPMKCIFLVSVTVQNEVELNRIESVQ